MMKVLFLFLLTIISPVLLRAQMDYYIKDSTMKAGIDLINNTDSKNAQFCQIQEGEKSLTYTPYQISEYGFANGRVYKSFPITIKDSTTRLFLERIVEGKLNLYYLKTKQCRKRYFIIKASSITLIEIPREKYNFQKIVLSQTNDNPSALETIKYVKYSSYYLQHL